MHDIFSTEPEFYRTRNISRFKRTPIPTLMTVIVQFCHLNPSSDKPQAIPDRYIHP